MIAGEGLVGALMLGLWVYCIFDVISTDEALIRNLPKLLWLVVVIFIPDVGSIAWLLLGRPQGTTLHVGSETYRPPARDRRPMTPDDDADFLAGLSGQPTADEAAAADRAERRRLAEWNEELKRREADLRRREMGSSGPSAGGSGNASEGGTAGPSEGPPSA